MTRQRQRQRLRVDGVVQGVGFRPFVFNLAESLGLAGHVANDSEGVILEIEGDPDGLATFRRRLEAEAPPLARIESVVSEPVPAVGAEGFAILPSRDSPGTSTCVPADSALCADCRREILDPGDRRHRYAFTNCTNCGPRWTIIGRIPYDRPFTSMAPFAMCPDCAREYHDPRDRRFHAQPNACPACGPRLRLEGGDVDPAADPLREAARLLAAGRILAVKGLGGFHLAARADDQAAVLRLRARKGREAKPLALMVADLDAARELAHAGEEEAALLASPRAPIVLLERRPGAALAPAVAPGHRRLGVMLAYTPLHLLLLAEVRDLGVGALVMTSGNAGDEPICLGDDEARARLADIADAWLLHDRAILRRADDSVVEVVGRGALLHRRSRGYAPLPVLLAGRGAPVLAVGPELKNTVCLLKENRAFLSPHVGDLQNLAAYGFFQESLRTLQELLECEPETIAHDLHPGYLSTRWAREQAREAGKRLVGVQHHHAHLAAVLAEHGHREPALGLILDGTGYGTDGTIWGGEILAGNAAACTRVGHLSCVPLPGGDAAIRHPRRIALSHLHAAYGDELPDLPFLADQETALVMRMVDGGVNSPLTSSCGRLFDAVAALTGGWREVRYEAQAAIELTALTTAAAVEAARSYAWEIDEAGEGLLLPCGPIIRGVVADVQAGAGAAEISARFHRTLLDLLAEAARRAARLTGLRTVALGGGSFQNRVLAGLLPPRLEAAGLRPLLPRVLPPNDGAVSLGQAAVARAGLA
jgi:hydrogenase maturation protein HypF